MDLDSDMKMEDMDCMYVQVGICREYIIYVDIHKRDGIIGWWKLREKECQYEVGSIKKLSADIDNIKSLIYQGPEYFNKRLQEIKRKTITTLEREKEWVVGR